jgi:neurotransmitter:Na+ symporter, NSS family
MKKQREHWGSQFGFMMAAAGSAIGLGTLWMFPYVTGANGGGLFVLLYFLFTFTIGLPIFIAELLLGRKAQRCAVGTFIYHAKEQPAWKIIGWLGVASSFIIMSFYSVVSGWGLNYILMSLNQFWEGRSPEEISDTFNILQSSPDITLFWTFIFVLIIAVVVLQGVRKGIEYWSRIMTSALLFALIGLFIYSTTLSGFSEAVSFIFYPDLAKFKPSGALEALGLSFFTLSLGQGVMVTYGSYMKRSDNIPKTAGIIGLTVIIISILAALMIFPIIFTYASTCSAQAGPGLVFKTLPIIFAQLPAGGLLISTIFFTLLVFTAITSAVALVEVIAANFIDLLGWSRKKSVAITCCATFIFGIPSALSGAGALFPTWQAMYGINFFDTMNSLVSSWLLPIGGFLLSIFTGWKMDKKVLRQIFSEGSSAQWLFSIWRFFLRWIVPLATILILLYKSGLIEIDSLFHSPPPVIGEIIQ